MNQLPSAVYTKIQYFIPRLLLGGLTWGDIVLACKTLPIEDKPTEFWQAWFAAWCKHGRYLARLAERARCKRQHVTAKQFYKQAAASYHFAEFMHFQDPIAKQKARALVTKLAQKDVARCDYHQHKLAMTF